MEEKMVIVAVFGLIGFIGYFFYNKDWKIVFLGLMVGIGVSFMVGEVVVKEVVVEKYTLENKKGYIETTTSEVKGGGRNLWIYCFYTQGGKCFKKTVFEKGNLP